MAYGNWGATVYKDGKHFPSREDAVMYEEEDLIKRKRGLFKENKKGNGMYHASLGNDSFRMVGYKCHPSLFFKGESVDMTKFVKEEDEYGSATVVEGEYEGYIFTSHLNGDYGNKISMYLKEPNGTVWTAECGYGIGKGYDH